MAKNESDCRLSSNASFLFSFAGGKGELVGGLVGATPGFVELVAKYFCHGGGCGNLAGFKFTAAHSCVVFAKLAAVAF